MLEIHLSNWAYCTLASNLCYILALGYHCNNIIGERANERDTLRSVQLRIADIYIYILYIVRAIFVLITRKEGGA